ncbi:MAG: hypothetical protein FWE11_07220 [Defluviitaleaceae bacterium]|nr:hypothetical protein [Defluviitaleaceae bacterium]
MEKLFCPHRAKPFTISKRKVKLDSNIKRWRFEFDTGNGQLTGRQLAQLYSAVSTFLDKYNSGMYIFALNMRTFDFQDKNVYIFLELLAYYILKHGKFTFEVFFDQPAFYMLESVGFQNTALYRFMMNQGILKYIENKTDFISFYENPQHLTDKWYRRVLNSDAIAVGNISGQIAEEVESFLKRYDIPHSTTVNTYSVVLELISNAKHNDGDCILDIDICNNVINMSFINLFDGRMFDKLGFMYRDDKLFQNVQEKIHMAIGYHSLHFGDMYTEDDFYFISTFQEGITTRLEPSGGTGLTTVVNAIAEEDENAYSYVLSGNNLLFLRKSFLGDGGSIVGFNKTNDYFRDIPERSIIDRCQLYIPGVVFQLVFSFGVSDNGKRKNYAGV